MDGFSTPLQGPFFEALLDAGRAHGIDPTANLELEAYFQNVVAAYAQPRPGHDFAAWIGKRLAQDFQSLSQPPRWIQGTAWPFAAGHPMVFIGQLDVTAPNSLGLTGSSFYLFWSPLTGEQSVILQAS
jgi:hypothetical protein